MKKLLLIVPFLCLSGTLAAQNTCDLSAEKPLRVLSEELNRNFKILKKQKPPVYYLSYFFYDMYNMSVSVSEGGIRRKTQGPSYYVQVSARAGSPQMDNTRTLKTKTPAGDKNFLENTLASGNNEKVLKITLWELTQRAARSAQRNFSDVQADQQNASERADNSDDFVFPPKENFCRTATFADFDLDQIAARLTDASSLTKGHAFVLESDFSFSASYGHRYFADSRGTLLKTPTNLVRMSYSLTAENKDGQILNRSKSYDVQTPEELPTDEQLRNDIKQSIAELQALLQAPEAEPITVPAILKNKAMAVFVHEVLGHRMEGHRQKQDSFGRTFTDKIGQAVVSPVLTIVDDATLPSFNNIPLRGYYEYDSEGVKVRPVTLIEKGVLKEFLMSSSPIKNFPLSNGHGRATLGKRPVARMGNTRVIADPVVSYDTLEKMLLAEIQTQQKPYGIIIEDLSGGFTQTSTYSPQAFKLEPTLVYRLYPDGRKEMIRGADMVGTPLVSFNAVIAAADDYDVFNGSCGAESGWVPVSSIAPSVLLKSLEIEKTTKSMHKPPVLVPPFAADKGDLK